MANNYEFTVDVNIDYTRASAATDKFIANQRAALEQLSRVANVPLGREKIDRNGDSQSLFRNVAPETATNADFAARNKVLAADQLYLESTTLAALTRRELAAAEQKSLNEVLLHGQLTKQVDTAAQSRVNGRFGPNVVTSTTVDTELGALLKSEALRAIEAERVVAQAQLRRAAAINSLPDENGVSGRQNFINEQAAGAVAQARENAEIAAETARRRSVNDKLINAIADTAVAQRVEASKTNLRKAQAVAGDPELIQREADTAVLQRSVTERERAAVAQILLNNDRGELDEIVTRTALEARLNAAIKNRTALAVAAATTPRDIAEAGAAAAANRELAQATKIATQRLLQANREYINSLAESTVIQRNISARQNAIANATLLGVRAPVPTAPPESAAATGQYEAFNTVSNSLLANRRKLEQLNQLQNLPGGREGYIAAEAEATAGQKILAAEIRAESRQRLAASSAYTDALGAGVVAQREIDSQRAAFVAQATAGKSNDPIANQQGQATALRDAETKVAEAYNAAAAKIAEQAAIGAEGTASRAAYISAQAEATFGERALAKETEAAVAERLAADEAYISSIARTTVANKNLARRIETQITASTGGTAPGEAGTFQRLQAFIKNLNKAPIDRVEAESQTKLSQFIGQKALTTGGFAVSGVALYGTFSAIKNAVEEANKFQVNMVAIQQLLKSTDEAGQFPHVRAAILNLSNETGIAGSEVAQLALLMKGAFGDTTEAIKQTGDALKVSVVSGLNDGEITNLLLGIAKAYNISIGTIGDTALGIQQRTGVAAKEVITGLGQIAPVASEVGLSISHIGNILAIAEQQSGRSAASIAENFNRILPAIQKNGTAILDLIANVPGLGTEFQKLGSDLNQGKSGVFFEDLIQVFDKLNPAAQNTIIELIGGRREAGALIPVLRNVAQLNELNAKSANDAGLTNEYFAKTMGTLHRQITVLSNEFKNFIGLLFRAGVADVFIVALAAAQGLFGALQVIAGALKDINQFSHGLLGTFIAIASTVAIINKLRSGAGGSFSGQFIAKVTGAAEVTAAVTGAATKLEAAATDSAATQRAGAVTASDALNVGAEAAALKLAEGAAVAGREFISAATVAGEALIAAARAAAALATTEVVAPVVAAPVATGIAESEVAISAAAGRVEAATLGLGEAVQALAAAEAERVTAEQALNEARLTAAEAEFEVATSIFDEAVAATSDAVAAVTTSLAEARAVFAEVSGELASVSPELAVAVAKLGQIIVASAAEFNRIVVAAGGEFGVEVTTGGAAGGAATRAVANAAPVAQEVVAGEVGANVVTKTSLLAKFGPGPIIGVLAGVAALKFSLDAAHKEDKKARDLGEQVVQDFNKKHADILDSYNQIIAGNPSPLPPLKPISKEEIASLAKSGFNAIEIAAIIDQDARDARQFNDGIQASLTEQRTKAIQEARDKAKKSRPGFFQSLGATTVDFFAHPLNTITPGGKSLSDRRQDAAGSQAGKAFDKAFVDTTLKPQLDALNEQIAAGGSIPVFDAKGTIDEAQKAVDKANDDLHKAIFNGVKGTDLNNLVKKRDSAAKDLDLAKDTEKLGKDAVVQGKAAQQQLNALIDSVVNEPNAQKNKIALELLQNLQKSKNPAVRSTANEAAAIVANYKNQTAAATNAAATTAQLDELKALYEAGADTGQYQAALQKHIADLQSLQDAPGGLAIPSLRLELAQSIKAENEFIAAKAKQAEDDANFVDNLYRGPGDPLGTAQDKLANAKAKLEALKDLPSTSPLKTGAAQDVLKAEHDAWVEQVKHSGLSLQKQIEILNKGQLLDPTELAALGQTFRKATAVRDNPREALPTLDIQKYAQDRAAAAERQKLLDANNLAAETLAAHGDPVKVARAKVNDAAAQVRAAQKAGDDATSAVIAFFDALLNLQIAQIEAAYKLQKQSIELDIQRHQGNPGALAADAARLAALDTQHGKDLTAINAPGASDVVNQAKKDTIAAGQQRQANLDAIAAAQLDLLLAQTQDPIKQAQLAIAQADQQAAVAARLGDIPGQLHAAAARLQAQRSLNDALNAIASAHNAYLVAVANFYGDTVKAAQLNLAESERVLNEAITQGKGQAAIEQAGAGVVNALAASRDAAFRNQESIIDFNLHLKKITTSTAIAELNALLVAERLAGEGPEALRALETKIYDLKQSLSQDLQFNLPSDLRLPTLYEARRLNQSGATNNESHYQDNRVVTIEVNGAQDPKAVANQVVTALNSPNRFGVRPRTYR